MGFYDDKILPHLIHCGCGTANIMQLRRRIVPLAHGDVLEVGMGSGLNLSLYNPAAVTRIWGLEPSSGMRRRAATNLRQSAVAVEWLDLPGENIPLADNTMDCVVLTYTLCTIPDWQAAMQQIRRVLKPQGQLLFCEHGQAPDRQVQRWQNRLNPLWGKLFGGCHLNRAIVSAILDSGFEIDWHENVYLQKMPRVAAYMSLGVAIKP